MYNRNDIVIINNIKQRPELNMKEGNILNYNQNSERYTVRIEEYEYNIKEKNLIKLMEYSNDKAIETIKNIVNDVTDDIKYINQWFEDKKVKCYILEEDNKVKSFVLLSKMDFDPMNKYNNPYTLNYIYTFPDYRRKNFAYILLCNIRKKEQLTAFTSTDISDKLFEKSNYINNGFCFRSV